MHRNIYLWIVVLSLAGTVVRAEQAAPLSALTKLPVREITMFKDGHAFVLHSGKMSTDVSGNVLMDYLPTPVIGTFWSYSGEKRAKLSAATASPRKVLVERTALNLRELIEANIGADVFVTESTSTNRYRAIILRDDRVLAQGLMTYASPGADVDLDVTTAVDMRVKKSDNETKRTPNAEKWQGNQY